MRFMWLKSKFEIAKIEIFLSWHKLCLVIYAINRLNYVKDWSKIRFYGG